MYAVQLTVNSAVVKCKLCKSTVTFYYNSYSNFFLSHQNGFQHTMTATNISGITVSQSVIQ